jgi:hypothetical protein
MGAPVRWLHGEIDDPAKASRTPRRRTRCQIDGFPAGDLDWAVGRQADIGIVGAGTGADVSLRLKRRWHGFVEATRDLDTAETLFIVCSKPFHAGRVRQRPVRNKKETYPAGPGHNDPGSATSTAQAPSLIAARKHRPRYRRHKPEKFHALQVGLVRPVEN